MKDFLPLPTEQPGEPDRRDAAELRGTIDYRPIFAAAHASGLEHFFAEQEGPFTRTSALEAAEAAYAYLRRVNSRAEAALFAPVAADSGLRRSFPPLGASVSGPVTDSGWRRYASKRGSGHEGVFDSRRRKPDFVLGVGEL